MVLDQGDYQVDGNQNITKDSATNPDVSIGDAPLLLPKDTTSNLMSHNEPHPLKLDVDVSSTKVEP